MKIAVIGAGVSGLVSAYLLSNAHDVTLFERNTYVGGHANTISVPGPEGDIHLDTGFLVYNEAAYPKFSRLLAELGVATQASDMSFSVICRACDVQYSSRGWRGFLAKPGSMLRPAGIRTGLDIARFYREAPRSINREDAATLTLDGYLKLHGYSAEFKNHFIVPLAAAVWSAPPSEIDSFPAAYMLHFLQNHGLIGGDSLRWRWRAITGGSRSYVKAITNRLTNVIAGTPAEAVTRTPNGVEVHVDGLTEHFDAVVLACHADEALALLTDADQTEQEALGRFSYTRNRAVLHTDVTFLPKRSAVRASWNYMTDDCRRTDAGLALTYHLNRLQSLTCDRDYCVSMNPGSPFAAEAVIAELSYDHPRYTFETLEGQAKIQDMNGNRRTYFAGAHLGYGFHEDGIASAYRVAALLGVGP